MRQACEPDEADMSISLSLKKRGRGSVVGRNGSSTNKQTRSIGSGGEEVRPKAKISAEKAGS
jgi:hypothetical protein